MKSGKNFIWMGIAGLVLYFSCSLFGQTRMDYADWVNGRPDGCTSITVGNKASMDGSVMTSHTCDSHRTR